MERWTRRAAIRAAGAAGVGALLPPPAAAGAASAVGATDTAAKLDDTQELNWPAICRAIVETGFTGILAHEFVPASDDPLASLRDAVARCDV